MSDNKTSKYRKLAIFLDSDSERPFFRIVSNDGRRNIQQIHTAIETEHGGCLWHVTTLSIEDVAHLLNQMVQKG